MRRLGTLFLLLSLHASGEANNDNVCSSPHPENRVLISICNATLGAGYGVYYIRLSHGLMPIPDNFIIDTRVTDYKLFKTYGLHRKKIVDQTYSSLQIRSGSVLEELDAERTAIVERDWVAEELRGKCKIHATVYQYSSRKTHSLPQVTLIIYDLENQFLAIDIEDVDLLRAMLTSFVRLNCA